MRFLAGPYTRKRVNGCWSKLLTEGSEVPSRAWMIRPYAIKKSSDEGKRKRQVR